MQNQLCQRARHLPRAVAVKFVPFACTAAGRFGSAGSTPLSTVRTGQSTLLHHRWLSVVPTFTIAARSPQFRRLGLTRRSSGAPTACHQARAGGTRYIFTSPGLASCRRRPLSSNVRPRRRDLFLFKMQLLGFASARHQPRLLPRGAGLLSPVWRQAALASRHRFVFRYLQRAKAACGTIAAHGSATATFASIATNRASVA